MIYLDLRSDNGGDVELERVKSHLLAMDPTGDRVATVIRRTLDQLYDGQRTGRWSFEQLLKTEKTHMGTLIEINLHREFGFADGGVTDYRIAGVEVDCKYSMKMGGWQLPPEILGHVALVITASDSTSSWKAGLIRVRDKVLNSGRNRDGKRVLSQYGCTQVEWLWPRHGQLAENLLLHLSDTVRYQIMSATGANGRRGGQARLYELCRQVQGRILRRAVVQTVGWGLDDPLKRMRGNGGARDALRPEGIVVLGHQDNDPAVARALGLPVPRKGEFVCAHVVPAGPGRTPVANIEGMPWAISQEGDVKCAAPMVPRRRS